MKKTFFIANLLLSFVVFASLMGTASAILFSLKIVGDDIYAVYENGTIQRWDKNLGVLENEFRADVKLWSFYTDGTTMYLGSIDGRFLALDNEGNKIKEINITRSFISALALDKDFSRIYLTPYDDKVIVVLNSVDFSTEKVIKEQNSSVESLALDDRYLYSGSSDGSVNIWDRQTMEFVKKLTTHTDLKAVKNEKYQVSKVLVYGNRLYTGHRNGKMRIWDLDKYSLIKEIQAHDTEIKILDTDGKNVYSIGSTGDNDVKIWTMEGEYTGAIMQGRGFPTDIEFEKNYIYLGVYEEGILVYDANYLNLVKEFGSFAGPPPPRPPVKNEAPEEVQNPLYILVAAFAIFFVLAFIADVIISTKKKGGKITPKEVKKTLLSLVTIEDIIKILIFSSIIIFIIGAFNTYALFPKYVPGLKAIYYFDIFVKRGVFLPVWFLSFPSVAYLATKRHDRSFRCIAAFIAFIVAAAIFILAPNAL